ncbi:cupin domain-containing protein [Anaerotignum sp. MSJ-24]|nr:cupin domain-containing protein [Anaerotignum sp. MSJ-24]
MQYNPYKNLPLYKMGPVVGRELLAYDEDYTVNRLFAPKGGNGPIHKHPHKQVVYVLKGSGLFTCGGKDFDVKAGDVVQIESNEEHTFKDIYEDTEWLEIFTPGREDFKPEQ